MKTVSILAIAIVVGVVGFWSGYAVKNIATPVPSRLAADIYGSTVSLSNSAPLTATVSSTVSSTVATTSRQAYEYKIVQNADECLLDKMGNQGWAVFQIDTLVNDPGEGLFYAGDCRTLTNNRLDWVVLQRQLN